MTTIDQNGLLVPKANVVADYTCCPECLHDVCLWDFLSLSDKCRLHKNNSTLYDDHNVQQCTMEDEDSVNSLAELDHTPHSDPSFVDPFTSAINTLYLQCGRSLVLRFRQHYPEYSTHALRIVPYKEKYMLVSLGPPLP